MATHTPTVEVRGLRWQPRWISEMGCMRPSLRHLGREMSWARLYGGTGYAFLLNIHQELCPSGWHVFELPIAELAANLGIRVTTFTPGGHEFPEDADMPRRQREVWEATRAAIDRGQPCYGYNLEVGDYYMVYGYDDVGYYYSGPMCDGGKGPLPWQDYGPKGDVTGLLCMGSVTLATTANEAKTVRDALAFAVRHARTESQPDDAYRAGLAGYDQWVRALGSGKASTWGAAYNAACYLECREAAVGFLKESKERLGGEHATLFDEAVRHYEVLVASLREVSDAFPTEGNSPEHLEDASRVGRATTALRAAKNAEAQGVDVLARIVAALDEADPPVPEDLASPELEGRRLDEVGHPDAVWGAGLPTAMVRALREHGEEIDYSDLAAGSGWGLSFSYDYENWHTAGLHFGLFDWLPRELGYEFESVSGPDFDTTWEFITRHLDRGTPVVTTLGDGGLVHAYRVVDGKRQFLFDGQPINGWLTFGEGGIPNRWDQWGVVTRVAQPRPQEEILPEALARAAELARPHDRDGVPLGLQALQTYLADVEDPEKDFEGITEWFCWATFERLTARACAAEWLRDAAEVFEGDTHDALLAAADHYQRAFEKYVEYDQLVHAEDGTDVSIHDRLRTPEKIALLAPLLREGIEAEAAGIASLEAALRALGEDVPEPVQQGGSAMGPEGPHMLEGLEHPKRTAAELACVEGALRYLGKEMSAAWLYGGTGHAFAINMRPTACVSSPYAWRKSLYELAPNLGFRVEGFNVSRAAAGDTFPARQREAYDMVRTSIDRGQPCYADRVYWMPDYALITGYDDVGYYYAHWDDRGGPTPWQKLGTEDIEVLDVWRVELCEGKPDDQVVRAALETVLARAATPHGWTMNRDQASGPWAFDMWADELAAGHALRDSHAYNACFWAEYREMAVAFLEEAKRRLPGRCDAAFDEAVAHYRVVRDKLAAVAELTPNRDDANWTDTLRSPESAELVRQAGAEERQGLVALAKIVRALGGTVPAASDPGPQETATSRRFVLQGVPKVAYYTDGRWRFTPFAHALDAALRYLGQEEQYDYLMCTSGAMFRMNWAPKAWDGGNSDILGMAEQTLEPMRRAFWSAGYRMVPVAKAEPAGWPENILRDSAQRLGGELTDEAGFRRRIVESINAGLPVIAFGAIGPPEACLITGYDESGDVLLGWNVFQDDEGAETEPSGYFRVRDWYEKTRALLLIGDSVGRPDPRELDRETLQWALQVLRTPRVRNSQAGPAAFDAWAADMLNDEYFPEGNTSVLSARLICHWDSMTVTATRGSGSATTYLLAAAERNPAMAEHLRAAADCLDQEDVVHGVAPGEEAHIARLADPAVRREVADSILYARNMHVAAADHIEKALLAAGVQPEGLPCPEPQPPDDDRDPTERLVLEGVPKVGYGVIDGHVGLTPFPACLRASLEYMGDDLGFRSEDGYPRSAVYAYLMGMTGAAFRLDWKPGWHGDNVASWLLSDDPSEIFRRGFAAAGYEQIASGPVPPEEREGCFRGMVIESIRDRGRPVIAHGVIGPPEEAIIAGYDEGGHVAIGWSFFQDDAIGKAGVEFEPSGYFRKRRWEADTWSMMAIGEKTEKPEPRTAYVGALQWALRVVREPLRHGDRHNGLAAYDAWAEHILRDDEVTAGGSPGDAFMVHSDATTTVAEGRWYASLFLRQAADVLPEVEDELLAAADCYKAEHDLMWRIWGLLGSNVPGDAERQRFLKPEARRRIVPIIQEARDKDAEAADHIEKALLGLGSAAGAGAGGPVRGVRAFDSPDVPKLSISNGVVKALVLLPDETTGYYRGTRFDWSGLVAQVEFQGHTYFGEWKTPHDPEGNDDVVGPAEEFGTTYPGTSGPLGYAEAKPGDDFIKIGVGLLRKTEEPGYRFWFDYEIAEPGTWEIQNGRSWVEFRQEVSLGSGWGYRYTKRVSLTRNRPELVISRSLRNTGSRPLATSHYGHNFSTIDDEPIGPSYRVRFPFPVTTQSELEGRAEVYGDAISFPRTLAPGEAVFAELTGFSGSACDNEVVIENLGSGAGLRIKGDQPLQRLHFWAVRSAACPEPFVDIRLAPGEQQEWETRYTFFRADTRE